MRNNIRVSLAVQGLALAAALVGVLSADIFSPGSEAFAQLSDKTDVNVSAEPAYDNHECAIAKNPIDKNQLFMACNRSSTGGLPAPGLFVARSPDVGKTWTDSILADGSDSYPAACCDPSLAWDTYGNLYLGYLNEDPDTPEDSFTIFVILISTDGGMNFNLLEQFATSSPLRMDRPTVVAANTATVTAGAPVWVWAAWHEVFTSGGNAFMRASGAQVTGPATISGAVGSFIAPQTIDGTGNCMAGVVAIAPKGAVVAACQTQGAPTIGPTNILVSRNLDPFGLDGIPDTFSPAVLVTTTNVGIADSIPAVGSYSVNAAVGLAYDSNGPDFPKHPGYPNASPHFGRLYMVYTDEAGNESHDTDIMLRYSDDDGANWTPSSTNANAGTRVNDDVSNKSQFLPRIASNPLSGNIAICWHDARDSVANDSMRVYCTIATPGTIAAPATPLDWLGNWPVADAASTPTAGGTGDYPDIKFGDYAGLAYFQGVVHPAWADTSDGTGDFDAYTDRVSGGAAANEGDPHIRTLNGVHYDFQSAGEFVALRGDGLEIQTRQTAIATTFNPGANPHTGLATCVSLNSAVAARVGEHRVTYQPNISGVPDPSGMQLRVDGVLTPLGPHGIDLGASGRIMNTAAGGIEITFPNEAILIVTPGWWNSQSKWYLNVNVYHTLATQGIMGLIPRNSWLPALPDGTSLGPRPEKEHDRYVALYETFADAWRVTDATSLFDYAPGTSTDTFTIDTWPKEKPPCDIPGTKPVEPVDLEIAQKVCTLVLDKNRNANCVFDVTVTGEPGFAKIYHTTQKLEAGATTTILIEDQDPTRYKQSLTLEATVARKLSKGKPPTGRVQFIIDGVEVGKPVVLDSHGRAKWKESGIKPGEHRLAARYIPNKTSAFFASSSLEQSHTVVEEEERSEAGEKQDNSPRLEQDRIREIERRFGRLEERLEIIRKMLEQLLDR